MTALARRYYLRGRAALERGDLDEARDALAAAVEVVPSFAAARIAEAIAMCRGGEASRAASRLRAGLARARSERDEAALYAALGDALLAAGDVDGAEDAFGQAARHPAFADRAARGSAQTLAKRGRYRECFSALANVARSGSA